MSAVMQDARRILLFFGFVAFLFVVYFLVIVARLAHGF